MLEHVQQFTWYVFLNFSFSVTPPQCSPRLQTQHSPTSMVLKTTFEQTRDTVSGQMVLALCLNQSCPALTKALAFFLEMTRQTLNSIWVPSLVAQMVTSRGTGSAAIHGRKSTRADVATAWHCLDLVVEPKFWVELFRGRQQSPTVFSGWILRSAAALLSSSQSTMTCLCALWSTFQIGSTLAPVWALLQTSCCGIPAEISPAALLLLAMAPNAASDRRERGAAMLQVWLKNVSSKTLMNQI